MTRRTSRKTEDSFRLPYPIFVLLICVIVLELLAPFVTTILGLDGRLQLKLILEFNELLSSGVFMPTWIPQGFYNFGATSFYFYPPVTFYLTALFHDLTGWTDPFMLFKIASLSGTVASFFSVRWLLRKLGSLGHQLNIGSALYAIAPLRIADLYSRSSLSNHIVYILLPFMWGEVIAAIRQEPGSKMNRLLRLALWFALIALTNVPLTIMTAICLFIAAIVVWRLLSWKAVGEIVMAAVVAAALACYHYASVLTAQRFARLQDLIFSHEPSDIELYFHIGPGTYYVLVFYAGVAILAGTYLWTRRKNVKLSESERIALRAGLWIAAFTLFLDLSPLSSGVWNALPPLKLIQFPWRFYCQILLFCVIIVGIARSPALVLASKWISSLWILGCILPIVLVIFSIHLFSPFKRPLEDATEYLPIYFNPPITATTGGVRGAVERNLRPHASDPAVLNDSLTPPEKVELSVQGAYLEQFTVMLQSPHRLTFHRFYWPYWHLYTGQTEIASHPDSLGRATALLPAGNYVATWRLERTPLETAGLWVSGIAWCDVVLITGIGLVRGRVKAGANSSP